MRTEQEVRNYLLQKAEKRSIAGFFIDSVIKRLVEDNYINDDLFIDEYVSARLKSKPKSTYVLTLELLQKGVQQEKINSYFELHALNEESFAKKALEKKWSIYKNQTKEMRFKKASDFLRRRGFSFSIIKKTIEELESAE